MEVPKLEQLGWTDLEVANLSRTADVVCRCGLLGRAKCTTQLVDNSQGDRRQNKTGEGTCAEPLTLAGHPDPSGRCGTHEATMKADVRKGEKEREEEEQT